MIHVSICETTPPFYFIIMFHLKPTPLSLSTTEKYPKKQDEIEEADDEDDKVGMSSSTAGPSGLQKV